MVSPTRIELDNLEKGLKQVLMKVCRALGAAGGRAWLVGGSVRDCALGRATRDLDLEVFGLPTERLLEVLQQDFALDLVGRSFGIIKLKGVALDVGLPRREISVGGGHRDFTVDTDPYLPLPDAAARRDFTINSVYLDPLTGEVADPWGGLQDLGKKVLRHTSAAFGEDPLRVLRGMQLVARFGLTPAAETIALCRDLDPQDLPAERIFQEWSKLLLLGVKPSHGLSFLADCGWSSHFPELDALRGCPQDPSWHPEGDVWDHTRHSLDVFAAERLADRWEDLVVGFAVLCHDMGKPATTSMADGRVRSIGHGREGARCARIFLERMTQQRELIQAVLPLVAEHMHPLQLFGAEASDAAVRRLATRAGRIDRLVRVARADNLGRPPLPDDGFPAGQWLLDRAARLDVLAGAPRALVLGRHLLELGMETGPLLGEMLQRCYQAQLDGEFATTEEGIAHASALLTQDSSDPPDNQE